MPLNLRPRSYFKINTGETFIIRELTGLYDLITNPGGYNGPNVSINAITATRFVFSSYLTEQAATTSTTIVAGREYTVGGTGNFTFNTQVHTTGDTFISMLSGTPTLSNCTLTETGRFSPVMGFLPTQVSTSDISPSLCGINDTVFPDSTYTCTYEIYSTQYSAGAVTVSGATQFIVQGTTGQTVTISAVVYNVGEILSKSTNFSFTGAATLCQYNNEATINFALAYYAYQALITLNLRITSGTCGNCQCELENAYEDAKTKYEAIQINFTDNLGLSATAVQAMLGDIITIVYTALKL